MNNKSHQKAKIDNKSRLEVSVSRGIKSFQICNKGDKDCGKKIKMATEVYIKTSDPKKKPAKYKTDYEMRYIPVENLQIIIEIIRKHKKSKKKLEKILDIILCSEKDKDCKHVVIEKGPRKRDVMQNNTMDTLELRIDVKQNDKAVAKFLSILSPKLLKRITSIKSEYKHDDKFKDYKDKLIDEKDF